MFFFPKNLVVVKSNNKIIFHHRILFHPIIIFSSQNEIFDQNCSLVETQKNYSYSIY